MRKRLTARLLTTTALATIFTGGVLTGTASASTVLAQGCTGTVIGNMGDQIAVQGRDVSDFVRAGAKNQEVVLHLNGVDPDRLAQEIADEGAITVAQVPGASSAQVTGDEVATAITAALKNADGLGWSGDANQKQQTLDAIRKSVAGSCGLAVYAGNYSAAGPATPAVTPVPGATGPGGVPVDGGAIAPPRDYGNIPAATPGAAASPGAKYPQDGTVAEAPAPDTGVLAAGQTGVRNTGNSSSLAEYPPGRSVQLPLLLAMLALTGVSVALVRTWVLRKAS